VELRCQVVELLSQRWKIVSDVEGAPVCQVISVFSSHILVTRQQGAI
jgi:hypothetical protein